MNCFKLLAITFLFASSISNANLIEIKGVPQLNSQVLQSGKPAVIKVSATWCGACTRAKQPYQTFAADSQNADIIFAEVDADASPDIVQKYNVQSLPTFLFIKNGQEVKRTSGFSDNFKKEMNAEISNIRNGAPVAPAQEPSVEKKTEETGQMQATPEKPATQVAEESGTCATAPDNFLERAYHAVRDFFTSIADTVRGWFK